MGEVVCLISLLTMGLLTLSRIPCPKLILFKFFCQGVQAMHINRINGLLGNILSKLKAAQASGS